MPELSAIVTKWSLRNWGNCPKKKEERDDNPEKREKLQDPGVM